MQDIRRANLRLLAEQWGGVNELAARLGYANGSFISQMCGPHPIREVTERTARKIENLLSLPTNWMDAVNHDRPMASDADVVKIVRAVADAMNAANVKVGTNKFADLVIVVYEHCAKSGRVDTNYINQLVSLLK